MLIFIKLKPQVIFIFSVLVFALYPYDLSAYANGTKKFLNE
ncbi:hypothetical protein LEP1GSC185_1728 [Leptospira licerasiae serovar Varillal str. VAR 010]|uniref:Uncharacterized protein n=1 Tax=Leptospira licerasiae str. MMD4847 TaxID=1049971 RepID=A0ABP2R9L6_9LEPT|nr:hypothetical protein LEP1GSC185_1728 [Leptospira licerasiae serovar Varillal str. VAR 010]EJZ41160.1 hypothetical protein LEP1GSC178_0994 [Leptospira licerasiae str. MMD4847]